MALAETLGYRLKSRLLGPPLDTDQLAHERLGKPTALAVFASDNLSSSAYATEEILQGARPGGRRRRRSRSSCRSPIALLVVLGFLILSYRQTIKAYPTAGGAYIVTRDNFGLLPGAGRRRRAAHRLHPHGRRCRSPPGTAAIASAFSALDPYVVPIAVGFIVLIAYGNLRGVKESGRLFAVPTYFFIVNMVVLLGYGTVPAGLRAPARRARPQAAGMVHVRRTPAGGLLMGAALYKVLHRLRLRRCRGHRRRGDLQRRPRVQASRSGRTPARRS